VATRLVLTFSLALIGEKAGLGRAEAMVFVMQCAIKRQDVDSIYFDHMAEVPKKRIRSTYVHIFQLCYITGAEKGT
jgi:hypothetical protein